MNKMESDFGQRLVQLLDEFAQSDSELASRCRADPDFHRAIVEVTGALGDFYKQMDNSGQALDNFERKLRAWAKTPPDAYIGFWGELKVADWLRRKGVQHRFIRETPEAQTPDIELTTMGRKVYFEIKTMQENPYMRFAERVAEELRQIAPGCGVMPEKVKIREGKEDDLVAIAVRETKAALSKELYSPIQYKGAEGQFSIVFYPGSASNQKQPAFIFSWPESRVRKEGTPWVESVLKSTLRDNIGQFETYKPTFLVWINFDKSLTDLEMHVGRVLEQYGSTEFVNVAGVIVFDPFLEWSLTPNPSYPEYEQLKHIGLFDAIGAFRDRSTNETRLG